jgi:competence protein ComEC
MHDGREKRCVRLDPRGAARGDRTGLQRLRARARACNPQPLVPWAVCVLAAALWVGCAWTIAAMGESGAAVDRDAIVAWAPVRRALGLGAVVAGVGTLALCARLVGVLAGWDADADARGESVDADADISLWRAAPLLTLIAIGGCCLGAALTIRARESASATPRLGHDAGEGGVLVTVEATVASGFTTTDFGPDLLASYFRKPGRERCELREVVFIADDGSPKGSDLALPRDASMTLFVADERPAWHIGERRRFIGRFLPIEGPVLPAALDYREMAAMDGRVGSLAIDSVRLATEVIGWRSQSPMAESLARAREVLRGRLREGLLAGVPEEAGVRPMLVALVLGDVEPGYKPIEGSFRAAGLAHILAISGFNLSVLGWLVAWIAGLVLRDDRWRAVPVVVVAVLALWVMAPAASAIRSALMAALGAAGQACGRDWNGDAVISAVAIAMLVHDPTQSVNAGFQLSFGCVLALRHVAPPVRARWLAWMPRDRGDQAAPVVLQMMGEFSSRAIAATAAAFVVSTPVVIAHFGSVQPMGTLLTFLCTPLSTATLVLAYPKAIVGAIVPAITAPIGPLLWVPAWLQVEVVDRAVSWFGGPTSIASGSGSVVGALVAVAAICVALMAAARWMRGIAWCAVACWMVWIAGPPWLDKGGGSQSQDAPELELTMFAIGDGSAYLLRSGADLVVFDGGSSSVGGVASRALMPAIAEAGGRVRTVFVSHPNLDHFSGLLDIVRFCEVGEVVVHDSFVASAKRMPAVDAFLAGVAQRGVPLRTVSAGDSLRIGALDVRVMWPSRGFRTTRDNDFSLVLHITHESGTSMLMTGDIETEPAATLLGRIRSGAAAGEAPMCVDVMELPHHGSWREVVAELVREVGPTFLMQSTARKRFDADRFGDGLPAHLTRLVTCRDATVRIALEKDGLLHAYRWDRSARPHWRHVAARLPRRRDQTGSLEQDRVAGDAVSAVIETDGEGRRGSGWIGDRDAAARISCVEQDWLTVGGTESDREFDARVRGHRLLERDLGGEDDGAIGVAGRSDKREVRDHGPCKSQTGELRKPRIALECSVGPFESIVEGAVRHGKRRLAQYRERAEAGRLQHTRDHIRGGVVGGIALAHRGQFGIGEFEAPSAGRGGALGLIGLFGREAQVPAQHARAVGGGELHRIGTHGRIHIRRDGGEHHGCDAVERDAAGRLEVLTGRCLTRFIDQVGAQRLDEARRDITVGEEDRVGVRASLGQLAPTEPQRRDAIDDDGDRTDPTVLPDRARLLHLDRARQLLSLPEFKDARAGGDPPIECSAACVVGLRRGEGDDGAFRDLAIPHTPPTGVDADEVTCEPLACLEQRVDAHIRSRLRPGRMREDHGGDGGGHQPLPPECAARQWTRRRIDGHGRVRSFQADARRGSALEDRQVPLGHLQHDERHRRPVGVAALRVGPRAIRVLPRDELVADGGPPGPPVLATREVHRLHRVVVAVEVVGLHEARAHRSPGSAAPRKRVLAEVLEAASDRLILVHARVVEARDSRRGARPEGTTRIAHVAETTIGVLALAHVLDGVVDGRLGHLDARVARAAQPHDLADGDRHIGIGRHGVVAPSTFVVLAGHNQLDGTHERVAHSVVLVVHAVDLAEEERGEPMAVHRAVRFVGDQEAGLARMREDEVQGLLHAVGEVAAAGDVSIRHVGDAAEARHPDVLAIAALAERPVRLLLASQVLESPTDRLLERGGDLRIGGGVLCAGRLGFLRRRWCGHGCTTWLDRGPFPWCVPRLPTTSRVGWCGILRLSHREGRGEGDRLQHDDHRDASSANRR